MHTTKKILALLTAVLMCSAVAGCGKSSDSSSSSYVDKVEVSIPTADEGDEDALTITPIPDGAPTELDWLSYWSLAPGENADESTTEYALFTQMGGSVKYSRVTSTNKYEKLANRLMANDPPDLFWYEQGMDFPANCLQNMFQPVDSIVDFDSNLWSDVKDVADQFVIDGNHFVAPITFNFQSVLTYDVDRMEDLGVDDPYDLYLHDEWDWNALEEILRAWAETGTEEEPKIGLNGWFHNFIFATTGETIVQYNEATGTYDNNLYSANLERAANWLYDLSKDGLIDNVWYGDCREAFQAGYLFYAMGPWASINEHTPDSSETWRNVPIPKDPNADKYYQKLDTVAYMWVEGSKKNDVVKTWMECAKIAKTDPTYIEVTKEKFFVTNPSWTDEMYELAYNPAANDKITIIRDPGYGISTMLSDNDAATNDSKEAIISYLYSSVSKQDENGSQYTWASLRDTYNNTIDSELKVFNDKLSNFQVGNYTPSEGEDESSEEAAE